MQSKETKKVEARYFNKIRHFSYLSAHEVEKLSLFDALENPEVQNQNQKDLNSGFHYDLAVAAAVGKDSLE